MKTFIFSFFIGTTLCLPLKAQWATNPAINNPISTATDDQMAPKIVSDNAGGAIMVWNDYRNSTTSYIYTQRINDNGYAQWTTDGIMLGKSVSYQKRPAIILDGFGGAIVSWIDSSSTGLTLYMQRVNALGAQQWTTGGVAIATVSTNYMNSPELLADGTGGATVTWADNRAGGFSVVKIYVQHINANGNALYTANGLAISSNVSLQDSPKLISDGSGGAIITYNDYRAGVDVYAQRINSSGVIQWALDGVAISTAANNQSNPKIVSDGSGGAIIVWQDERTGVYDIYYQRINATGVAQWANNGVSLSTGTMDKIYPAIVADDASGFFIAWQQYGPGQAFFDIYAQRVNQSGVALWTANGNGIGVGLYDQLNADIITDGVGGAIVTWEDYTGPNNSGIRAQRINGLGTNLWSTNGAFVTTNGDQQDFAVLTSDGASGAIVAWQDYRTAPNYDIYAQKINASGIICTSAPASPSILNGSNTVCPNTGQNYSVAYDANVTSYAWTLPNGWTGTSITNNISVATSTAGGLINVMASNSCGNSSTTSLSITVTPLINVGITQSNAVLTAATNGASYQWYTCPNFIFAPGIFYNQSYTVTANGDYAVTVTLNGCTNTSKCLTVSNVGLNELTETIHYLNVFPNPSKDKINIRYNVEEADGAYIEFIDVQGKVVKVEYLSYEMVDLELNIADLPSGFYILRMTNAEKSIHYSKLIKN